jgi:hypothetical protein
MLENRIDDGGTPIDVEAGQGGFHGVADDGGGIDAFGGPATCRRDGLPSAGEPGHRCRAGTRSPAGLAGGPRAVGGRDEQEVGVVRPGGPDDEVPAAGGAAALLPGQPPVGADPRGAARAAEADEVVHGGTPGIGGGATADRLDMKRISDAR